MTGRTTTGKVLRRISPFATASRVIWAWTYMCLRFSASAILARLPRRQLFQEPIYRGARKGSRELVEQMRRKAHLLTVLSPEVHRRDLWALVAQFVADGLASNEIERALRGRECPRNWTTWGSSSWVCIARAIVSTSEIDRDRRSSTSPFSGTSWGSADPRRDFASVR